MANYWAIAIGINQYYHFQPLMYAQRDAQVFRDFLIKEGTFPAKQCYLLTDASFKTNRAELSPTRDNIQSCILRTCQQRLKSDDFLWCFFSGYGVKHEGNDYLMPLDGNPNQVATSGISIEWLFSVFATAPTKNIVLVLDVNRNQSALMGEGVGEQTAQLAKEHGIPVILSCTPDQFSHETLALRQGLFTTAVIEGLRYRGCTTLEQLMQYLEIRLPELSEHHWRPQQTPFAVIPTEKKHQFIVPPEAATTLGRAMENPVAVDDRLVRIGYGRSDLSHRSDFSDLEQFNFDPSDQGRASSQPMPEPTSSTWSSSLSSTSSSTLSPTLAPTRSPAMPRGLEPTSSRSTWESTSTYTGESMEPGYPTVLLSPEWERSASTAATASQTAPHDQTTQTDDADPVDTRFWRRLLMWSSIIAAILLVGVILRNLGEPNGESPLLDQASIAQPEETSTEADEAIDQPLIQAEPGSALESAYVAIRARDYIDAKQQLAQVPSEQRGADYKKLLEDANKGLLSDAKVALTRTRELTNENQTSDFVAAIELARMIQPNEPQYQEAQQYVERWSRVMFDMAQGRADRRNDSSTSIAAENYRIAIDTARLIPSDNAAIYKQAQDAIAHWSERIFELANDRASEAMYDVAVQAAELIPPDAPIYPQAQEAIAVWLEKPTLYVAPTP